MKTISFTPPDGFAAPEDSEPGKPFDVLATVVMGDNGEITLQAVDGIDVAANETESEDSEMEDESSEAEDPGFLGSVEAQFPS